MFKWKFEAIIYKKFDGKVLFSKMYDTYEEAQSAIEENITKFMDKEDSPTGHINKNYIQLN
jgi:hypothetical protein